MSEAIKNEPAKLWKVYALLGAILMLAAGLRIARMDYGSLNFDEMWHLELSTGRGSPNVRLPENKLIENAPDVTSLTGQEAWYSVWTNMDYVVHPPLYCTLLHVWRDIFGEGDRAARSLSIVCSLVSIALMFLAGWELNGLVVAAWAALIFAVAPTQVMLAQQVRGYDLLATLGMGAILALVKLEKSGVPKKGPLIALGLCVIGMMLTHYFAAGACLAIGIYVLIRFRGSLRRDTVIVLVASAILYLICWGPFLWRQRTFFAETADTWLIEKGPRHFGWTFGRLAAWCWWLVARNNPNPPIHLFSAILLMLPAILMRKRKDLLLWYLWLGGTLGFVALLDLSRSTSHLRFSRYVSLASPAVFMLFAGCLRAARGPTVHIAAAIVVIAALAGSSLAYDTEGEPDWRPFGEAINQHVAANEPLIFYPGQSQPWYPQIYYLGTSHYSHALPRTIVKLSTPADAVLMGQLAGGTAWLISGPPDRPLTEILPGSEMLEEPIVLENLALLIHVRLTAPHLASLADPPSVATFAPIAH